MKHTMMQQQLFDNKAGYSTLFAVIIITAIGVVLVSLLSVISLSDARMVRVREAEVQSRQLAHSCAEVALMQLRDNTNYTGTDSVNYDDYSCSYTVTNTGGETRRIESTANTEGSVSRILVIVDGFFPVITITRWQEVTSF